MELQCKERVDLLEALKKSREEPADQVASASTVNGVRNNNSTVRQKNPSSTSTNPSVSKQWLGNDTVPQASYEDLPKVGTRQNLPGRPANPLRPLFGARKGSDQDSSRTNSLPHADSATTFKSAVLTPPPAKERRQSRTPSPEKKGGMLRTLRTSGKDGKDRSSSGSKMPSSMRNRAQPAAAKAASQVWSSGGRTSASSADQQPAAQTVQGAMAWDPYTRSLVTSSPTSERHDSAQGFVRVPSPSDFVSPVAHNSASDNSEGERKKVHRPAQQSYLNEYRPANATNVTKQNAVSNNTAPPVPTHSASSWFSGPKVAGKPASKTANKVADASVRAHKTVPQPPTVGQAGQAQSLTYLKEFPNHPPAKPRKPSETAIKEAANLAVGSRSSSGSTAPPIPRKAVGVSRASGMVNAVVQRQQLDNQQHTLMQSPVGSTLATDLPEVQPKLGDPVMETGDEQAQTAESRQAWDTKTAAILKDLPKGVDEAAAKQILNEIVIQGDEVHWSDVAGLEAAKSALKETVVYPFLRPDLFMGLREPARGMLLFGPPGTGKTMLARAVATESKSVFFAISASSLTSKYLGDSEKLVRALFQLAKAMAPSIIFVDEIDSLLGSRGGSSEHEATRRIKTEFLIQWSDLQKAAAGRVDEKNKDVGDPTRVLVLAATNLPWAIDEAARRRFVRRQYIPLPEDWVRKEQLQTLLAAQKHSLNEPQLIELVRWTDGEPSAIML